MASFDDKKAFSERLAQALKRNGRDVTTATQLAMQFNLRHPNEPITVQAAQKWLTGKARPTQDKVETLARWLDVSVEWLRFGLRGSRDRAETSADESPLEMSPTDADLHFLSRFKQLSTYQQRLIAELVDQLNLERELSDPSK